MTTWAYYSPEGRTINLAQLSPADYALITSLHREINRRDEVLLCLNASADDAEMYVKYVNGRYFSAHFPGGAHGDHKIALESDEHLRMKDYLARGVDGFGLLKTKQEDSPDSTAKHDVAISGGVVQVGLEVQRRLEAPGVIKARTTKSFNLGWRRLWFNGERRDVPPSGQVVPYFGCSLTWDVLPPARSATAIGIGKLNAAPCVPAEFDRCPETGRRHCGKDTKHPQRSARGGLAVDDIGPLAAIGELKQVAVPVTYRGKRASHVQLVTAEDFTLYQELTGRGEWVPGQSGSKRRPKEGFNRECTREHAPPVSCQLCGRALLLTRAGRSICESCRLNPPFLMEPDGQYALDVSRLIADGSMSGAA